MRHRIILTLAAGAAVLAATAAQAQITSAQQSALRASCRSDFMSHCSGVTPGGKDALMCLQKNVGSLSGACQSAVRATLPVPAAAKAEPAPRTMAPAAPPPAPAAAAAAAPSLAPAAATVTGAPPPKAMVAAPPRRQAIKPIPAAPAPAVAAVAAVAPPPSAAPDPAKLKALKFTCRADFRRLCKHVPEGPEALACLQAHSARLSPNCRTSVADIAASMPAGGMPTAMPVVMKPAPVPHRPKAPIVDAAVMIRACKLDMIRHCRGVGVGGGKLLACLTAHEENLTFRCRAAMKVSSPLH
jgi:hypothetical protein